MQTGEATSRTELKERADRRPYGAGARPSSRRDALRQLTWLPLSTLGQPASSTVRALTFVLVHGGWHGGWCWKKVVPLLSAAGHRVFTPTLTGLGERAHLLSPQVNLDTHIEDIRAVLFYEDLTNVVLVGHSSGGMVLAGVAPLVAARLARVIYLDAFLPDDGTSLADYANATAARPGVTTIPPPGVAPRWGVSVPEDVAWMEARLGPMPAAVFTQKVRIREDITARVPHTYIRCTAPPQLSGAPARAQQRGFRYRELLGGGHDVMISRPRELAALLLE